MATLNLDLKYTDEPGVNSSVLLVITPEGGLDITALNLADVASVGVLLLETARALAEGEQHEAATAKRPSFNPKPL